MQVSLLQVFGHVCLPPWLTSTCLRLIYRVSIHTRDSDEAEDIIHTTSVPSKILQTSESPSRDEPCSCHSEPNLLFRCCSPPPWSLPASQ